MHNEIQEVGPEISPDKKRRAGLTGIISLVFIIVFGILWASGTLDRSDEPSPFGEVNGQRGDILVVLDESFSVDANGAPTPELEALVAELQADGLVAEAEYLEDPDDRADQAILVSLEGGLLSRFAPSRFVGRYEGAPGIEGFFVSE